MAPPNGPLWTELAALAQGYRRLADAGQFGGKYQKDDPDSSDVSA
jgi:hypothetical protein